MASCLHQARSRGDGPDLTQLQPNRENPLNVLRGLNENCINRIYAESWADPTLTASVPTPTAAA